MITQSYQNDNQSYQNDNQNLYKRLISVD